MENIGIKHDPRVEQVIWPMDGKLMPFTKKEGPLVQWYDDRTKCVMRGGPIFRFYYACKECKTVVWKDYGKAGVPVKKRVR